MAGFGSDLYVYARIDFYPFPGVGERMFDDVDGH